MRVRKVALPTPGMLAKGRRRDIDGAIRKSPAWHAQAQAIGRSRGGRATKIRATVDARERPVAVEVTPGHVGDVRVATALITGVPAGGCLAATRLMTAMVRVAFFSNAARFRSSRTIRPAKRHHPFDETAYRQRNLIERMFCRLKDWRRIAIRYDKLPANSAAAVILAAVIIGWT